jgi:hypothetical protein
MGKSGERADLSTYNSEAHSKRPKASPRVSLDSFPYSLLVFVVLSLEGIVHQVLVGQDV